MKIRRDAVQVATNLNYKFGAAYNGVLRIADSKHHDGVVLEFGGGNHQGPPRRVFMFNDALDKLAEFSNVHQQLLADIEMPSHTDPNALQDDYDRLALRHDEQTAENSALKEDISLLGEEIGKLKETILSLRKKGATPSPLDVDVDYQKAKDLASNMAIDRIIQLANDLRR